MLAVQMSHLFGHLCMSGLVNALLLSDTVGTRFLGPLMCQQSCDATLGCSGYGFSQDHLMCRVLLDHENIKGPSGGWTIRAHSRQWHDINIAVSELNRTCAKHSRIFYSRAGTLSCASDKTVQTKHEPGTLLLLLKARKKQPLFQFYPKNKTFAEYPNPSLKDVKAITYLASLRRVIVSLADTFRISYFTLGTSTIKTIKSNIVCIAISVDVTRGLLVIAITMPFSALYTITPDGQNYTFLCNISQPKRNTGNYPSALVVDPKRKCVYVCLKQSILSVDLEGKTVDVLFRYASLHGMGLDPVEDVLYFGRKYDVMRASLGTMRITTVVSFREIIFNISYDNDHIYVSMYRTISIFSVNAKDSSRKKHTIFTKETSRAVLMCLIPKE